MRGDCVAAVAPDHTASERREVGVSCPARGLRRARVWPHGRGPVTDQPPSRHRGGGLRDPGRHRRGRPRSHQAGDTRPRAGFRRRLRSAGYRPAAREEIEDELRDRIRYLERQVEEEREARRRADLLLSQLMDRVPQLEAPREAPEALETAEEEPERAEPRSGTPGPQTAPQCRPLWRRVFGGQ